MKKNRLKMYDLRDADLATLFVNVRSYEDARTELLALQKQEKPSSGEFADAPQLEV